MTSLGLLQSVLVTTFLMFTHPLFLVIILICQTLFVFMQLISLLNCSWLTMILFLIFLGGLLVIFAYLSALIPNETENKILLWVFFLMSPVITYGFTVWGAQAHQSVFIEKMNTLNDSSFVLFLMMYLLTCLLVTMSMTQYLKSPLHQESY